MKILVTGGAGFLGSHMVDYLLKQSNNQDEIYIVDNLQTGSLVNLKHLNDHKNVHFIQADVINALNDDRISKLSGIEQVYHMACAASPPHYQKDPIHTTLTCVVGTYNMLTLATQWNARFLITSTSEVYGDPAINPQVETYWGNVNCTGTRSCYDEGKRTAETLCFDFNRTKKTDIRVARIFNTYGPRMNLTDGRIISNFVYQALKDIEITVYGSGHQTRSFCYVSDQIEGLYKLMNQTNTIGPVNIGNPDEHTVLEMAQKIRALIGETENNKIVFHELPQDDPKVRKPDITKAKTLIGWEPKVHLDEGLALTIEDFSRRVKEEVDLLNLEK
ncbi:hypothetical protein C9374_000685 [Naegleria lovaniensis]|uniref:UDP-glucuronic acid decarboxylase 1 n=1 Tax=Naegleria lovaniensis TaxID=51637 RepID=A0AA88GYV8_NAELO|nr:uncharacterized protein C9374_000685 [Naegleria lovaniensis]KAG2388521.1 hypothetical protein C9374_000685 [Naegleria lovaniensis]